MNWKVRFRNKVWLSTFFGLVVGFVFNLLKMFDIAPVVTENTVLNIIGQALTLLGLLGVIVDPTTAGIGDSDRAMTYEEPWNDEKNAAQESDHPPEAVVTGTVAGENSGSDSATTYASVEEDDGK